jgi:hypothetical protein
MDKLEIKQGSFTQQTQYFIPVEIDLSVVQARLGICRVAYLSSSDAYINNWGLFGKENYLAFDWWIHFL